ncbi:phenazine biosynthesis [Chlorella sorokiniana]|uniref:Phenazine biosynthesis n=1 Tax=Chlorella sorokiniana TaxID=3076 RepID=A0A2P6TFG0_CHLSO|nr:phenazine biosynthesis [Chlorella sorokiniana]|eukprot:PRW32848.1 phenazine biosynthesis [Chlorella sorokiniana]
MPLTVAEGALLGAGMLFAGGATMAYKAKQTRLFKTLYFLSWPTLGSAVLWTLMPTDKQMEQELKASGLTQQQLDASRAAAAAQMQQLKAAAEEAKR